MNDLQKCQLEILRAFIAVCEEHHLQYYLVGGTAIGAIRHQGFIPWDDDIDVGLPRADYDKFVSLTNPFKDSRYFTQTYKTDPNYLYNFAKIRDSNTTFIEKPYAHHQINHGVWIDVYPIDGMSYENKPAKKLAKKVHRVWGNVFLMYLGSFYRKITARTWYIDIPLNIVALLFWWTNVGHYRNKMIDNFARKIPYDKAVLVGNLFGNNANREAMPKEIFEEGSHIVFEGVDVIVPKDYDRYLTLLFGDYMKLPPVEKRVGHHYHKGLSLTVDYKTFCKKNRL